MLNFAAAPEVLEPLVPAGTEIDFWHGRTFLSVVGFRFLRTRLFGVPVPFHRRFDEVNLRFYIRRRTADGWRRGVVFVKEIVHRRLVSCIARWRYNENFVTLPVRSRIELPTPGNGGSVAYTWLLGERKNTLETHISGAPALPFPDSEEEFITEHYWGYTRQRDGSTLEYQVEHPPWRVWRAADARLDCAAAELYGPRLAPFLSDAPTSAFVAEGSRVVVRRGIRI